MGNMIHDELTYENVPGAYHGTVTTQTSPFTKEVLVGEIEIKTFFGNDVAEFNERYKYVNGDIKYKFNVRIKDTNFMILSESYKYKSDGKEITERDVEFTDIIQIYATIRVPVEYEIQRTGKTERYQLDFNPTPGHKYHIAEDGFQGFIPLNTDESIYVPVEHPSQELLAKQMNIYMIPYRLRYVNAKGEPGDVINATYFYNTLHHSDNDKMFTFGEEEYDMSLLRLGKVAVQSQRNLKRDMVMLDTRTRGGGIKEGISRKEIELRDKQSLFNWDIGYFDGEAYQENGIVVLRVSNKLLDGVNDTAIKETLFRKAMEKYKAMGVYPIIEFYDPDNINTQLLENEEFIGLKHINYYSEPFSAGEYKLDFKHEGAGDDFMLVCKNNAYYSIRVPGYKLAEGESYTLEMKGRLSPNEIEHNAATVTIYYKDGSKKTLVAPKFTQKTIWQLSLLEITIQKEVLELRININETSFVLNEETYIDYVKLLPKGKTNQQEEIYEL